MNQKQKKCESTVVPGVFKAIKIDGRWLLVSGTLNDNMPEFTSVDTCSSEASTDNSGPDGWMARTMLIDNLHDSHRW
jgi:hypothetical protein